MQGEQRWRALGTRKKKSKNALSQKSSLFFLQNGGEESNENKLLIHTCEAKACTTVVLMLNHLFW
jgi:hypothetical protein